MNSERCWQLGLIVSDLRQLHRSHSRRTTAISVLVECRVTDYGEGTSNVSPGRGRRIVAALARSPGDTIDQGYGPRGSTSAVSSPLTRGRRLGQANPQPSRRQGIIKASLVSAAQDESPSRRTCDNGGDFDCGGRLLGFYAGNQGHQLIHEQGERS